MDKAGIESVIQIYFDSSYELDKYIALEEFHPDANIYSVGESGSLMVMTVEAFVGIFDQLESPKSARQPREDKIISVDFTGENTAVARVALRIAETRFTDILCFALIDGRWRIISKTASGVSI